MRTRLLSAAVLVPVVAGVFLAGMPWLALGIAALGALAGLELVRLLRGAGLPVPAWPGLLVPPAVVLAVAWPEAPDVLPFLLIAAATIVAAMDAFRRPDIEDGWRAFSGAVFVAAYGSLIAGMAGIVAAAPAVPADAPLAGALDAGRLWLLVCVLCVWSFDSFAYLVGRAIGRGRFLNHISPKKTWSGVLGGTLAAVAVGAALGWAVGAGPLAGAVVGVVVAVCAQAGDVAESLVKRAAGAKDSGSLIPGHGGVLDRGDSFLFAAPALWMLLVAGRASGVLA
ncbi:MAG: phosphatidate cytidylyltransferase [Chloroflexota bacterium]